MENDDRLSAPTDDPGFETEQGGDARSGDPNRQYKISQLPDVVRLFADQVLPVARGSHMQLSLLAEDHDPFSMKFSAEANGDANATVETSVSYVEIGKVRMPTSQAFSMAMQIVELSIRSKRIKAGSFRSAVNSMLDHYESIDVDREVTGDER